ncbi:acyltransferase [Streptomyces sp. NPDC097619]|uniref:acyltransferase family protein n=1 Tax=Streptomyces sp. NPDC097619 TaxID=3157228 RepID=UPI0033298EEB
MGRCPVVEERRLSTGARLPRIGALVRRIDAGTPRERDRSLDALRAFAIAGVVLGHWLVTALTDGSGVLRPVSPLAEMPWLAPVSWVFQTLAVFFFVGGRVAADGYLRSRSRGVPYRSWLVQRLSRLLRPVLALLGLWAVIVAILSVGGVGWDTVWPLLRLVLSPLWFLVVFAALTAATPWVARLHPGWPAAVVFVVDVVRFGLGGPGWLGWVNVAAGWLVPYCLGATWSTGRLARRRDGVLMLVGGAVATFVLVVWAGYPSSMVGVPGAPVSNLNPPTLAAVTFGLAQCGLALLVRDPLARALRRPLVWAAVALVNLSAMTVFLWHQTAMMAVTALGLLVDTDLPGLHRLPSSADWIAARLLWLPVFALALAVCQAAFHIHERGPARPDPGKRERGLRPAGFRAPVRAIPAVGEEASHA